MPNSTVVVFLSSLCLICSLLDGGDAAITNLQYLGRTLVRREVAQNVTSDTVSSGTSTKNFITYLVVGCVGALIIASLIVAIYYAVCKDKGVKTKHDTWVEAGVEIYGVMPSRSVPNVDKFRRLNSDATSVSRNSRESDVAVASKRNGRFSSYKTKGPNAESVYADVVETIHRLKAQRYLDEFARKPYGRDRRGRHHRRSASRNTSFSSQSRQSRQSRGWYSEADVDTRRRVHSLDLPPSRPPGTAPTFRRPISAGSHLSYMNGIEEEDMLGATVLDDGTTLKSALKWPSAHALSGEPQMHSAYVEDYPENDPSGYFSDGYLEEGYDHPNHEDLGYFNAAGFDGTPVDYNFNQGFDGDNLGGPVFGQFDYPMGQDFASPEEEEPHATEQDLDYMERPYNEIAPRMPTHRPYDEVDNHMPMDLEYSGYMESDSFHPRNRASFHQLRRSQAASPWGDSREGLEMRTTGTEC